MKEIFSECPRCVDGVETISVTTNGESIPTEITCRTCLGANKVSNLFLSDDLIDFLNDLSNRVDDILEKLNE